MHGMEATSVDAALDLDASVREVVDPTLVDHVAMDRRLAPKLDRLDDRRRVFMAALRRYRSLAAQHRRDQLVVGAAPVRPVVRVKAALAQVSGPRVPGKQLSLIHISEPTRLG